MANSAQRSAPVSVTREVYRDVARLVDGISGGSTLSELRARIRSWDYAKDLISWRKNGTNDTVLMALSYNGYIDLAKSLVAAAEGHRNKLKNVLLRAENSTGQTALDSGRHAEHQEGAGGARCNARVQEEKGHGGN